MELIQAPKLLRDTEQTTHVLRGPFKLTHNGRITVGLFLDYRGTEYTVFDGERAWPLDSSYAVQVHSDTIVFYSENWKSKFVIQALTQKDVEWILPEEPDLDIEGVKELVLSAINSEPGNNR